jgi:uncharacterized membrane protein
MPDALFVLTLVSALGSGLAAGVFFAFSSFVMPGLGRLPAAEATSAMQAINVAAISPAFMSALFGTALTCAATMVYAVADWDSSYGPYLLAGGALYLLGVITVTMAANVPRNNALERLEPTAPETTDHWVRYLREWTAWNHIRSVAPLVGAGLMTAALYAS